MLVCDTSGLIAFFDASESSHARVAAAIDQSSGPFVVSPYVVAELDYLLMSRRGSRQARAALTELATDAWVLESFDSSDLSQAIAVMERFADQEIGVTDASIAVLADRVGTDRILTLDRRHFDVLRTTDGRPFTIIPE